MANLLTIRDLSWYKDGDRDHTIFHGVNFTVNEGDFLVLTGKSGSGKSTLLKCLAHLNQYSGEIEFRGKKTQTLGIPQYRTKVLYVPQRPALLPGTPRDFLKTVYSFRSRQSGSSDVISDIDVAVDIAEGWSVEPELWDRPWGSLSGGESQRIALASAISVKGTEVLLLDEPTSALDGESVHLVEQYLQELPHNDSSIKAVVCITHSEEQASRMATRRLRIENGGIEEFQDV
ncbi:ATP-binding cassette transporter [Clavulina sp. PMI_390]|nr:ATP-binding cassette transporter [Clavulina sp. PMI_390]